MKQKYDFINDFTYEETYYDNNEEYHRYICWLKFPYASTDSKGGFFSFHTEEEFNYYIIAIYKFKVEDILEERIEYDNYSEFLSSCSYLQSRVKAIDLLYKK